MNLFGKGNIVSVKEVDMDFLWGRVGKPVEIIKGRKKICGYIGSVESVSEKEVVLWISGKRFILSKDTNIILIF